MEVVVVGIDNNDSADDGRNFGGMGTCQSLKYNETFIKVSAYVNGQSQWLNV